MRVTDGDTVVLKRLGKARLVGIDTPEVFGTHECYGRRASAFTKRLLAPGSRVTYRFAVERRDRYGRALVYMWKGKTFANAELVRRGYAVTLIVPPNVRYAERFRALAAKARAANRGLWSPSTCNGNDDKSPTRPHGSDTLSAGNKTEPRRSAPLSRHDHASRDKDCSDFSSHAQAQKYFEAHGGPASDPDRLDADHDGIACESGASTSGRKPPPSGSSSSDGRDGAGDDLDLSGDKDCSDFSSHAQAQKYFEAKGGPRSDPDRLDADHDGTACDSL